jgi:MFS family permease
MRNIPRSLLLVTLGMIIANLAGQMYYPILPLYLESLGASVQEVGLFFTLQVILAICFRILGGWISDHMGRLPTIAVGSVFGIGAITGYTVAPTWQWAAIGALMGAVGSSLVGPSFQAYTAEQAPEGKLNSTFGLINGLFLICAIAGPPLGGYMADHYGFKTMMWTATGIFYAAAGLRIWMARHSRFEVKTLQPALLVRDMRLLLGLLSAGGLLTWLFLIDGLSDAGNQVAFPFLPHYTTEVRGLPKTAYGSLLALLSLVSALAMWPCGRFADRFGERVSIALGMLIASADMLIIILTRSPALFALGFAIFGVAQALIGPAFSGLISKAVPQGSLGITWGVFMTALGILAIPAPTIGGLLYDHIAPEAVFVVSAACTVLAVPLVLLKLRVPAQAGDETVAVESVTEKEAIPVA